TYLFKTILGDFILVLIILFSPEIRHALETMGRSSLGFLNFFGAQQGDALYERKKKAILETCKACNDMSAKKIGALIVFERNTMLGDVVNTGTTVNAKVTRELLGTIFFPNTPLHDGGVVIRDGKVCAAGCILPLTENNNLSHELGTRHRASLGISEKSDAVVVVVSEETGKISIACGGNIERDISDGVLIERMMGYLLGKKTKVSKREYLKSKLSKNKEKGKEEEIKND
ncbi:MAG: diadenylate cyclase CdaA, partial [Ruminococcus sp.]|nr:diadenylate cyclase CdaA [Candidatus Copronaster equi]